jgi:hypothetical protein
MGKSPAASDLIKLGDYVPELGGIYAGIVRGNKKSDPDQVLVVSRAESGELEEVKWKDAIAKFDALVSDGQKDWRLPNRRELCVLMANVPELFERRWYWSSEPYAGDDAYAWCQYFGYGDQFYGHKPDELRARAVRSIPVQSFDNSAIPKPIPRRAKATA